MTAAWMAQWDYLVVLRLPGGIRDADAFHTRIARNWKYAWTKTSSARTYCTRHVCELIRECYWCADLVPNVSWHPSCLLAQLAPSSETILECGNKYDVSSLLGVVFLCCASLLVRTTYTIQTDARLATLLPRRRDTQGAQQGVRQPLSGTPTRSVPKRNVVVVGFGGDGLVAVHYVEAGLRCVEEDGSSCLLAPFLQVVNYECSVHP